MRIPLCFAYNKESHSRPRAQDARPRRIQRETPPHNCVGDMLSEFNAEAACGPCTRWPVGPPAQGPGVNP
ncbi:unnamed protein product [Merluccius merluccius]